MSIEILTLGRFEPNDKAVNVALPVLAFECEATPPIENYLDAYEEAVLKLVSIGLSSHGIAGTMNATESLIEEILDNLEQKKYVEKEIGRPWKVTDDGKKYLSGEIGERESELISLLRSSGEEVRSTPTSGRPNCGKLRSCCTRTTAANTTRT